MGYASTHFQRRVAERIGPSVDAEMLARDLISAIQSERWDFVEFVARVNRDGCRLFRFRAPTGRLFYALVNTDRLLCVTVMPPGFTVPRQGKARVKLRETDL